MKNITKYFRNALAASTQNTISFKDGEFGSIMLQDLQSGIIDAGKISFLWKNKWNTGKEEKEESKDIILAAKTIKTEFLSSVHENNDLDEMTCIFFVPAKVSMNGTLFPPKEDKWPWIPREFLESMVDAQVTVGNVDKVDEYLENTTDKRNQIKNWKDYLLYAQKLYEHVTWSMFYDAYLHWGTEVIHMEQKCYIFPDETVNAIGNILRLYNYLLVNDENLLYAKLTNGKIENSKKLFLNTDMEKMKIHAGQMNGEYPLSSSQREVIHHLSELKEGDVLAVSGPPGTGKTTLLQSVVASEYVERALKQEKAPIIVAASTNNQAVTNIIDSFSKIEPVGIDNLEVRWIDKVHSFAAYFPSASKMSEARGKNYQCTDITGSGFVEEVEDKKNRINSRQHFLEQFNVYYKREEENLNKCCDTLTFNLRDLESRRRACISDSIKIKAILGNESYAQYLSDLLAQIDSAEGKISANREVIENAKKQNGLFLDRKKEWQDSYDKLPWWIRLLKFLPFAKKRILNWSFSFVQEWELEFLKRNMSITQIQEKYMSMIEANDMIISRKRKEIENIQGDIEPVKEKHQEIQKIVQEFRDNLDFFNFYKIFPSQKAKEDVINKFDISEINDKMDKVRYVQFWLAVHYYECRWLIEERRLTEKQIGKTYENIVDILYTRIAMLTPCLVMTFHMLPKQFCIYDENEKCQKYMSNYIDLLIVDEAGQTSPEIAFPSFYLAKKAVIVGDEQQIPPVWGITRPLDIALAQKNRVIADISQYKYLEANGLNCSQSSVMAVAGLSCAFNKYGRGLLLREHRRCYDEIIEYSNRLVYNGNLQALRGSAENNPENPLMGYLPALGYKNIITEASTKAGGSRCNRKEAEEIAKWVKENFPVLCQKYPKTEQNMILGIITPFKAQSVMIRAQIKEFAPSYMKEVTVGTVHTFQGAERCVIIFSSVYGNQDRCFFINQSKSLMNVAVSRAKDSFLVFGDRGGLTGGENSAAGLLKNMTQKEIV